MAERPKADWVELNPTDLGAEDFTAFMRYKEAYKAMKAAKVAFEDGMQGHVDVKTQRMIFGYNYGKLSVAIVPHDPEAEKKKTKAPVSLAQYLAERAKLGLSN